MTPTKNNANLFYTQSIKLIKSYAKKKGMFNPSQAIEDIIEKSKSFSEFVKLNQTGVNTN